MFVNKVRYLRLIFCATEVMNAGSEVCFYAVHIQQQQQDHWKDAQLPNLHWPILRK